MPVAHLNDTELFYLEVGEGLPCLIMHGGLGLDHTYMHPWLDPLGDVMHLVYYDHRNNGRSGRAAVETLTFETLCADADALREYCGFEQVTILGHSYGGFIALEYALRYPERLSHLILSGTAPAFDYEEEIADIVRRKGATQEQVDALEATTPDNATLEHQVKLLGPLYWHNFDADLAERVFAETVYSAEALEAGFELLEQWDVTPCLGEIRTPTLILVGRHDFICPPSRAKIMHEGIPGSELVVFERSGHFPYLEEPDTYFRTIRGWLGRR